MDRVYANGAQGPSVEYDMNDREVKPDPKSNWVDLVGLESRQNQLRQQMGLPLLRKRMSNREAYQRLREQARQAKKASA